MWKISFIIRITIIFDDNLKTTSFYFLLQILIHYAANLIALHFNYWVILYWWKLNYSLKFLFYNKFTKPLQLLVKILRKFFFASSIIKNIVVFPALSKFAAKLICWIALGSASSACCLLKSIAIVLKCSLN